MKKIYKILLIIFLFPFNAYASVFHCSAPSTVSVGETFTVKFSGSLTSDATTWKGTIYSPANVTLTSGSVFIYEDESSFSKSVSFKALSAGTATFYVYDIDVSDEDRDDYSGSDTCTVEIKESSSSSNSSKKNNTSSSSNKSSDTNLKSLTIDEINIDFDKDTLEYNVEVENDIEKIKINTETNDKKAKVTGDGFIELEEGLNKIEVIVTAENGATKTYTINVKRKEKNPILVKVNNKNYTVIRKEGVLNPPLDFEKIEIVIDDENIVAYENKELNYVLVGLTDEENNSSWFIYDSNKKTYTLYKEFLSNNIRIVILESNDEEIPYKYKKTNFKINNIDVTGYALNLKSDFRLVYALNIENNEKDFYLYDLKNNTFQRFYNEQVNIYINLMKKIKIGILGLISIIIILFLIILIFKSTNSKMKKYIRKESKMDKKNNYVDRTLEEQKLEHTRQITEINLDDITDKKALKKKDKQREKDLNKKDKQREKDLNKKDKQREKDLNKKMKEERKKFLDE